jgi:D-erythrulose 1-phosphate 3-epimerase
MDANGASSPRIHLTMDNAFAAKRWTAPREWARVIRDLGITCVEASADTEADPFYCGEDGLASWADEVRAASAELGTRVVNLFTGYTTYRTLGLAHPDPRVRRRVVDGWLGVASRVAGGLGAGLGFYLHAFPESVLQDPPAYARTRDGLYDTLAEVARRLAADGCTASVLEQMYSPHQIPWTIDGTREVLAEVARRGGPRSYVALDTGHQTGQRRFLRPARQAIERALDDGEVVPYLGSDSAYALFEEARGRGGGAAAAGRIAEEVDRFPHLFAQEQDCDLYRWLEEVGPWSPIVHLQQSNGRSSAHLPFVRANNAVGIVSPPRVLEALARGYQRPPAPGLPPRVEDVYLTFEIFFGTADRPRDILPALAESVRHWRRWVPVDGARLDELLQAQRGSER